MAARLVLVEASPALRDLQTQTLQDYAPRWVGSVSDLPEMPTFLVANEFFDALPIRQFLRDGAGWRERLIGVEGDSLAFGLGPISEHVALRVRVQDTKDGDLVELCAAAIPIVTTIAGGLPPMVGRPWLWITATGIRWAIPFRPCRRMNAQTHCRIRARQT